jgi:hypothetical protein
MANSKNLKANSTICLANEDKSAQQIKIVIEYPPLVKEFHEMIECQSRGTLHLSCLAMAPFTLKLEKKIS